MRYRKRPVVIDAFIWTGDIDQTDDPEWIIEAITAGDVWFEAEPYGLRIRTLEGVMVARRGDYVIRGIAGEIYPCRPEIFEASYEVAE